MHLQGALLRRAGISSSRATHRCVVLAGATQRPGVAHDAPALGALSASSSQYATQSSDAKQQPNGWAAGGAGAPLDLRVAAYSVWGAGTNVGKTLASVGLAHAASALRIPLSYIKPVQTGFPQDSDARLVALASGGSVHHGAHAAQAAQIAGGGPPPAIAQWRGTAASGLAPRCSTLFAWHNAVSPHLAVKLEGRPVNDDELIAATHQQMRCAVEELLAAPPGSSSSSSSSGGSLLIVETAGGVSSPAPSGALACDALRPLRLPVILVGDPRLGGISATLCAYDSLLMRGWDVDVVLLIGSAQASPGSGPSLDNADYIREHLNRTAGLHRLGLPPPAVVSVPGCPPPPPGHSVAESGLDPQLAAWLQLSQPAFTELLDTLQQRHAARLDRLAAAQQQAAAQLWWPFTQHASLQPGSAMLVDSRCGEEWTVVERQQQQHQQAAPAAASTPQGGPAGDAAGGAASATAGSETALQQRTLYDACASWWTQAAPRAAQPEVARAVAYAAGRYLHVLFPEVAHEPALRAAGQLLGGPGAGWASRVFFSDNGSTAIEVALKMAFRKFLLDRGMLTEESAAAGGGDGASRWPELQVVGLANAYHGDTLGAQDCVAPSPFNAPPQAPWYRGRGLFLEPPYIGMTQGRWRILDPLPPWLQPSSGGAAPLPSWASLEDALEAGRSPDSKAASPQLAKAYRAYIAAAIDQHEAGGGALLAACIIEPLVQGAGGMLVIDPLFQAVLAQVVRSRGIPLILDEVFTGLYRMGALSAGQAMGLRPDIACYAKLLTGGAVPMAATLATEQVFKAFDGKSKLFALLHGHSYTAFPIGCAAAASSMELLSNPNTNPNLCCPQSGRCQNPAGPCTAPCGRLLPLWDNDAVQALSYHPLARRVVAVGTVLAVELHTAETHGSGYGSVGAVEVAKRLRQEHGVYVRPLGSVVYLMGTPLTAKQTCAQLLGALQEALDDALRQAKSGDQRPREEACIV